MDVFQVQEFYKRSVKPIVFKMDPETAHNCAHDGIPILKLMSTWGLLKRPICFDNLQFELFGKALSNPVGLAAGFDKNATLLNCIDGLGVGFVEVGSITGRPSKGNPRPRLFRLPGDQAVINFMGLNGDGADVVAQRLKFAEPEVPFGINIAKTNDPSLIGDLAVADILHSFKAICKIPASYVAINVSCPNTQEEISAIGKELSLVLGEIRSANINGLPILIKLSPDSDDRLLDELVSVASGNRVAGFICGNTSMDRSGLINSKEELGYINRGGMSGRPLKPGALDLVRRVNQRKERGQIIIGCGGIASGEDAFDFVIAGASLLEIYTCLVYEGPLVASIIAQQLSGLLAREGLTLKEAVGSRLKLPV